MQAMASHPFAQGLRDYIDRAAAANGAARAAYGATGDDGNDHGANDNNDDGEYFVPPVDVFRTDRAFVLHMALPGARKEDISVDWNADRSVLSVAGIVHRPGDEAFQSGLLKAERSFGLFRRDVPLPPLGGYEADPSAALEKDGGDDVVDAVGITAKMEDGVLVVFVPKVEKEWTEVRRVDIE